MGERAMDILTCPAVHTETKVVALARTSTAAAKPKDVPVPTTPPSKATVEISQTSVALSRHAVPERRTESDAMFSVLSSPPLQTYLDQERRELLSLIEGSQLHSQLIAKFVDEGRCSLPQPEAAKASPPPLTEMAWALRELELTSKFTGIIRRLETLVAEQNVSYLSVCFRLIVCITLL